jgi:hypothetical protein
MKSRIDFALVFTVGLLMMPAQTKAQCPTGVSPLQLLIGTWTYSTQGFRRVGSQAVAQASAGQFTAGIGTDVVGNQIGLLSITQSSSIDGQITRLETIVGQYQVSPDCSGGSLLFNLNSGPVAVDFFFVKGSPQIRWVSTNSGVTISGIGDGSVGPGPIFFVCATTGDDAGTCKCNDFETPGDCFNLGASGQCVPNTFDPKTSTCKYIFDGKKKS